jgi:outer membrane protein assembly factor BamB
MAAAFCSLLLPSAQLAAAVAPRIEIAHRGDLVGVAGGAAIIDTATATARGRDIQAFDLRDGHPLAASSRLARAFGTRPPFGGMRALGDFLVGTTPNSDGGVTIFDLRANTVRFRVGAAALAYTPMVAPRLVIAVGRQQEGTIVLGVTARRGPCGVAIEAREVHRGRVRWRWSPPEACRAVAVAVDGDRVFVHSGSSLHALSLSTGTPLWRVASPCLGAPTCFADVAAHGREVALAVGTRSLTIVAAETGAVIRQLPLDAPEPGQLALEDHRACIGSTSRARAAETTLFCVGLDGQHPWTQKLAGFLAGMELDNDTLYVAAGGGVHAIDASSGALRWRFGADRVALARLDDGVRVVVGTDDTGALVLPVGQLPGQPRELTVAGTVTVQSPPAIKSPPLIGAVALQVAGTSVRLTNDGHYQVALRLNGGRLKFVACGCKACSNPDYLAVDARTTYRKDITFEDTCID